MPSKPVSERAIIFLIGAVQFVNILDFMMVMPLAPYYSGALGFDSSRNGLIAGSYTAAASIAGLLGGYFLDRFDRRKALAVSMLGLVLATAAGSLATGLTSLMVARVCAGIFGGPATSLSLTIVADLIPAERRGKAMGAVMGAFSIAQVAGLPLSLMAATHGGWRAPFLGVAGMGLLVVMGAIFFLPPVRGHLEKGSRPVHAVSVWELLSRRDVQLSYLMSALVMMSSFVLVPNIPSYVVYNLGYSRDKLWVLYLIGGVVSLATLRLAGSRVDKLGSFRVGTVGVLLGAVMTYVGFVHYPSWLPVYALFIGFMLALGMRNVATSTLASKVPEGPVRARFMSLQSAITHMASSIASAVIAPMLLFSMADGRLEGIDNVALVSIALALTVPFMIRVVERRLKARASAGPLATAVPALAVSKS